MKTVCLCAVYIDSRRCIVIIIGFWRHHQQTTRQIIISVRQFATRLVTAEVKAVFVGFVEARHFEIILIQFDTSLSSFVSAWKWRDQVIARSVLKCARQFKIGGKRTTLNGNSLSLFRHCVCIVSPRRWIDFSLLWCRLAKYRRQTFQRVTNNERVSIEKQGEKIAPGERETIGCLWLLLALFLHKNIPQATISHISGQHISRHNNNNNKHS